MIDAIRDRKVKLRQQCKAIRNELDDDARQQVSETICAHLSAWNLFQKADVVLTYMRSEVDLRSLLTEFPEKHWLIPRILSGENGQMVFHPYDIHNLILHPFGMAEPAPYLPQVSPSEVQLVLAPGLAFDRSGWRLGYGGGYYDRFLVDFEGVSAGVVFQVLLFDALPHGEYDVPVGWIASENGIQLRQNKQPS